MSGPNQPVFWFVSLGRLLRRYLIKLLKPPTFLRSAGLAAGQFPVYKTAASTIRWADPAKNPILLSHLESRGRIPIYRAPLAAISVICR